MSDSTLDLAMRITAVDVFSGVLRRFRTQILGAGADSKRLMHDYDQMVSHLNKGMKGLFVTKYGFDKLKPAIKNAVDLQASLIGVKQILQGAHPEAAKLADQMQRVEDNSIAVARHMKYSAIEITNVTRELIQAGVPLQAILDHGKRHGAAYYVEALAETKGYEPSEAARQLGNIGHAFQLRPSQYGPATDLIARASVLGSGTLQQLFHNLEQAGAIVHGANPNPARGLADLKATVIALKALAPLGEQGGSDLAAVIQTMEGGRFRGTKYMRALGVNFYDKQGRFIGLDAALERLKKVLAKLPDQHARLAVLGRIFQAGGSRAILQLLAPDMPGVKSYDEMKHAFAEQASLVQQMKVWEEGVGAKASELATTSKTLSAVLFEPALAPSGGVLDKLNEWFGALTMAARHHKAIGDAVTYGAGGLLAAGGAYSLYHLFRGAGAGMRVFRGLGRGLFKTGAGVAEGKALQAAAGVTPVFVVNMPSAGFGAGAAGAAETGVGASIARTTGPMRRLWGSLAGTSVASLRATRGLKNIAGASLKVTGAIGFAASAGWALGRALDSIPAVHRFLDKEFDNSAAYALIARLSGAERNAVELSAGARAERAWRRKHPDFKGAIKVTIDQHGRARVTELSSNRPDVQLHVGHALSTP